MKDVFKLGLILLLVTAVAATGLAAVYSITKPRIELQKKLALERGLSIALPSAHKNAIFPVVENDQTLYYKGYSDPDSSELVGYAFVAYGVGYSSTIETMVGIDPKGIIIGMTVLSQVETPGLGTKIEETKYGEDKPWFQLQFVNKIANDVAVDKDGGDIQSITGATISSRAVTQSIVEAFNRLNKKISLQAAIGLDKSYLTEALTTHEFELLLRENKVVFTLGARTTCLY